MGAERAERYVMTPEERFLESMKLWDTYLALRGSLEPEPDTQSPFSDPEEWHENAAGPPRYRGSGAREKDAAREGLADDSPDRVSELVCGEGDVPVGVVDLWSREWVTPRLLIRVAVE